jgi:hypothetical protein
MMFLDENNVPIVLESIDIPTVSEYFWSFSLKEKDFMLNEIITFEEMEVSSLLVSIMGYVIELPTNWNILIYSPETSQLDILEVYELTKGNFYSVVYNHRKDFVENGVGLVRVIDYYPVSKIRTPSLHKSTMLCHPVGPNHWVCVSPTDNFNKYLKDSVIGDLYI